MLALDSNLLRIRVLLVDRSEEVRAMLTDFLQELGYVVMSCSTGNDAVTCATSFCPHVVFSSIRLQGLNGFELCARLRQIPETADALIVAFTGDASDDSRRHAQEVGFDRYFLKPVQVNAILELLDSYQHHREGLARGEALTAC